MLHVYVIASLEIAHRTLIAQSNPRIQVQMSASLNKTIIMFMLLLDLSLSVPSRWTPTPIIVDCLCEGAEYFGDVWGWGVFVPCKWNDFSNSSCLTVIQGQGRAERAV
jgi:hypothetical protein